MPGRVCSSGSGIVRVIRRFYAVASQQRIGLKATNASESTQWDIFAGVALIRQPLIAPSMTEVEKTYADVLQRVEEESSLKCDFELKQIKDSKLLAKRAQLEAEGKELSALDEQIGVTAESLQDDWSWKAEILKKQFAIGDISKVEENVETSLRRKLTEKLCLIVKQKFNRKDNYSSPWILPQSANRTDENLKQTVERCISDITEGTVQAVVLGNAPFSMYTYRYPSGLRQNTDSESVGAKVFFFNALISPQSHFEVNTKEICEYKWVTADEFAKFVESRPYRNALSPLFLS
ncbi:unnamed protein product [Anisakis simplex]|uniref:39S ribosomal protein L46, mitochondrial n=1 Tax=Anisakis simplex TaxID=6269 RepID=A0A0M3JRU0_ANISI|nr:unnamed protein product [Anisakis simplex]